MKIAGNGKKTKAACALTDEEVDVYCGKELLGLSSPESMLNTLWLNNTQHFGLRGCQEYRNRELTNRRLVSRHIEEQANKYTLSKTKRDVSLLKEFIRMKGEHKKFENIEARKLDQRLCAFIAAVNMNQQHYGRLYSALTAIYGRRVTPQPS